MKTLKPPFTAFLIREPIATGYTDSLGVSVVKVLEIDLPNGRALCASRVGKQIAKAWEPFASLASSITAAQRRLEHSLSALALRAPQTAVAVTTTASAEITPSLGFSA